MTAAVANLYPIKEPYPGQFPGLYLVENAVEPAPPIVISVAEMDSDNLTRHRAAQFIGQVLAENLVVAPEVSKFEKPIESLRDAIQWAAKGDEDGKNLVNLCVETEMVEQVFKSGHVTDPVTLHISPDGKIIQFNQSGDSIQANSLQIASADPTMRERTKAETRNHFRTEDLYRQGLFEEYSLVVFSLAEDVPEIFFTDTMSCSIQVTSKAKTGNGLQLETAFVAGIAEEGAERHDLDTIVKVGDMLGEDYRGKTPAEIIGRPVLIHNSLIPNGAIDVVEKLWDKASGTFFGEDKAQPCSYAEYRERCYERAEDFRPKVDIVREQLISEAPQIKTRLQAIERLHELSEAQMVEKAVEDHTIDVRVFGPKAAGSIEKARLAHAAGDTQAARQHTELAIQTADTISCAFVKKKKVLLDKIENGLEIDGQPDNSIKEEDTEDGESDEHGSLVFNCTEGHRNVRKRHEIITECQWQPCKEGSVGCGDDSAKEAKSSERLSSFTAVSIDRLIEMARAESLITLRTSEKPQKTKEQPENAQSLVKVQ